ncbi:MAG: YkgJ family cysteine cluster protein [Planctomycetota bacterium]
MSNPTPPSSSPSPSGSAGSPGPTPWYANGLHFSCKWPECRACCTGSPGYVWITLDEAEKLAAVVEESLDEFLVTRCKQVDNRVSLIEVGPQNDCTFLAPGGCSVYEDRPQQCRTYPFWPEHLVSEEAWNNETKWCPGINHGRLWTREEIDAARQKKFNKPFWYDTRVVDDIRRDLLEAVRENFEREMAERRARGEVDDFDDSDVPWTDDQDDDDDAAS